jgi:hypothetical protein
MRLCVWGGEASGIHATATRRGMMPHMCGRSRHAAWQCRRPCSLFICLSMQTSTRQAQLCMPGCMKDAWEMYEVRAALTTHSYPVATAPSLAANASRSALHASSSALLRLSCCWQRCSSSLQLASASSHRDRSFAAILHAAAASPTTALKA